MLKKITYGFIRLVFEASIIPYFKKRHSMGRLADSHC